ncbi:hypothetical protein ACFQ3P_14630 [Paraburkholderia sabiae]|jgi:hypothetical protein|uniref:Uncharacterized protein n=1 Tax=Paraburkholderia sabiae TaxID=273251 RepID=A0ABU9Q8L7_9BURK|nr:hypothetical protein [Paraburkholderia sabiae]WJZ77740.1 hypothetical protein QEN71_37485 [Paraburkholderia sabiae]CAD6532762.1 hypothetical protein LMG24235_02663 [Paraburkholderia sabiae]
MMRTLTFPRFRLRVRPAYAVAACSLALATTCAYQAPGLMQAILVVGANAQLPLERLAAQADMGAPGSSTAVSSAVSSPVSSTSWKDHGSAQKLKESVRSWRTHRETHGYARSVTDYKYWT